MIVYPIQKKDGLYYLIIASTEKKVMDDMRNIICSHKEDDAE